jgi:predicted ATPase
MRGNIRSAHELHKQLLSLAQRHNDPAQLLVAHRALGASLFYLGEVSAAHAHTEQGLALYDPQRHRSLVLLYGFDHGSALLTQDAWALWVLGAPDRALAKSREGIALAQELAHPFSVNRALLFAGVLHLFRREERAAQERAEAAIALSMKQGFAYWLALGTILRGWTLTQQGQAEEGIAQMTQGLTAYRATGGVNSMTLFLALLAEVMGVMDTTEERFWGAEIHRLKGELLLGQALPDASQAETCFQTALVVAHRQQAKSLELRAAMSLSRLWQRQGKRDAARQLLAPIYDWFTEGFDTADLQEARVLLEELSQ